MVSSNLAQSFYCPEYDNKIKYKFYSLNNKNTDINLRGHDTFLV